MTKLSRYPFELFFDNRVNLRRQLGFVYQTNIYNSNQNRFQYYINNRMKREIPKIEKEETNQPDDKRINSIDCKRE